MPADAYRPYMGPFVCVCLQELVRKVCVRKGMVDEEVKSSVNAYVVYKDEASVDKVGTQIARTTLSTALHVCVSCMICTYGS